MVHAAMARPMLRRLSAFGIHAQPGR
jgi:hypothetical protein